MSVQKITKFNYMKMMDELVREMEYKARSYPVSCVRYVDVKYIFSNDYPRRHYAGN